METAKVKIAAAQPYEAVVGRDILPALGALLTERHAVCAVALVADDIVDGLYGDIAAASLTRAGFAVRRFVFPHGEAHKNIEQLTRLLRFLAQAGLSRADLVVALGGGVTGDLAGLAAALYQRGICYVQAPTTFLAAIDASVGGKTAVDLPEGKNLAGAFWQPAAVFCDIAAFATLPAAVFADGIAEALKYGVLADAALFRELASGSFQARLVEIVRRCVEIKAAFVRDDERDEGCRQLLNLGHTLGHAVEQCSGYTIPHGHAVAIGMAAVSRGAAAAGVCDVETPRQIMAALAANGLPSVCPLPLAQLVEAMRADKKRRGDTITLAVPERVGQCRLLALPMDALPDFFAPAFC